MTFEIIIPPRIARRLDKLDAEVNARIRSKLRSVQADPVRHCKRLTDSDFWSLRVGAYRVVLDIRKAELIVLVLEVVHRSKAYRD